MPRFKDSKWKFSVDIPEGWKYLKLARKFKKSGGVMAVEDPLSNEGTFNISCGSPGPMAAKGKKYRLQSIVISLQNDQAAIYGDTEDIQVFQNTQLGGESDVVHAEFKAVSLRDNVSARFGKISAIHRGIEYFITYCFPEKSRAKLDNILNSWRFES